MKVFPFNFFRSNFHLTFIALIVVAVVGCTPSNSVTVRNYSSLYKSSNTEGILSARAYHINDSITRIYFKIKNNQSDSAFIEESSLAQLRVALFETIESTKPFDSTLFDLNKIKLNYQPGFVLGEFELKIFKRTDYQAEIALLNYFPLTNTHTLISLNKLDSFGQYDMLLIDDESNLPIINDYVSPQQVIRFKSERKLNQEFGLKLFDRNFGLALPPFGVNAHKPFDYIPDSIILLDFNQGLSNPVAINRHGIYHLELDKVSHSGVTCFLFDDSYPSIEKIEQLIFPLRYITSKAEYQAILESENQKGAIDKFWLSRAGNEAKARKMIKEFYSRVEKSNRLFSSHNEGWKTDRGMIYLVYGPPTNTYRNNNFETWIYGFEGTQYSITFNFTKVDNPFTNNDYTLNRSSMYKTSWYQAVESWREGRITLTD